MNKDQYTSKVHLIEGITGWSIAHDGFVFSEKEMGFAGVGSATIHCNSKGYLVEEIQPLPNRTPEERAKIKDNYNAIMAVRRLSDTTT